jgi:hypothetical protein
MIIYMLVGKVVNRFIPGVDQLCKVFVPESTE